MDEDYGREMLRQKRIDEMPDWEFYALFDKLAGEPDLDDEALKQLTAEAFHRIDHPKGVHRGC